VGHRLLSLGVNVGPGARALSFAEADATRVRNLLTSSRGSVNDDAELLVGSAATREAVLTRLYDLRWFPPTHQLTIFFSGHGSPRGLLLADGELTYAELATYLSPIPTPHKVLVVDACFAGAAARLFNERIAGFGGEALDEAWLEGLERACPGLRIFAAVGHDQKSREDTKLRGGLFTCAWLAALRTAPGDLLIGDNYFISDLWSFQRADSLIAQRYPNDPRPQLISRCKQGTLPLLVSQHETPMGFAYVVGIHSVAGQWAAVVGIHAFERRNVATFVEWTVVAMTGTVVGKGRQLHYPKSAPDSFEVAMPADVNSILGDRLLGSWLRQGTGVELTWHVDIRDDVGHYLDRQVFSDVWLPARVA
jgi:hypothetical protein